jgi:hypothetical protein
LILADVWFHLKMKMQCTFSHTYMWMFSSLWCWNDTCNIWGNSWLSSIQAYGILMQLAKISKKICHFYKVTTKAKLQCMACSFTCHMVVLPAVAC